MSRRSIVFLGILWLILITSTVSSFITVRLLGSNVSSVLSGTAEADDGLSKYAKLERVRQIIKDEYYLEVDDDTLLEGAIRGMLESLDDRYTFYYSEEDMVERIKDTTGEYKGLGIAVTLGDDDRVVVTHVFRDTPAKEAGIESGDFLWAINGEPATAANDVELDAVVTTIANFGDAYFDLTLKRGNDLYTCTVKRENVVMNRVEYAMLDNGIGYIQITEFLGDDVKGFSEALDLFGEQGDLEGLIIDLRDNTGGYLDDVVAIADQLLPEMRIIYTEDRYGKIMEIVSDEKCLGIPVAVLVNGFSASASEVLSGAIQDAGIGVIIGTQTFGKGIVQTVLDFGDGTGMQLTTSTYYTPAGRCIHGVGITPDIVIEDDKETEPDEVLEAALDWFAERNASGQ